MLVLTVDDSDVMRQMVRFTLESTGQHRCLEAEDGLQALELLKNEEPDLIITDLNMPHVNGIELTRKLRCLPTFKYTPIILLTTEKNPDLREEGKEAGASGWLQKPFNPEKLLHLINKYNVAASRPAEADSSVQPASASPLA